MLWPMARLKQDDLFDSSVGNSVRKDSTYSFTVTIETHDLALLHCLRALSFYCQQNENRYVSWGGSGKLKWENQNHQAVFRFSEEKFRSLFMEKAKDLFPSDRWRVISTQSSSG
jgi:hypothetical protein